MNVQGLTFLYEGGQGLRERKNDYQSPYLVTGVGFSKYHCHMRPKPIPKASSR
jgi:hypothetical protein